MKKSRPPIFSKSNVGAPFRQKRARKSFQKCFLTRRSSVKQQKQNRCPSDRPWQRSFWPNTTTNQQYRGTSLSMKIIASSLCNFILVDCCIVASFLDLVKNTSPWPCWPWQLRFPDGITSNPTDTCRINQVEYKLKSDATRFFLICFFLIEIHRQNAMVEVDDDRREVSLLFVVGCSTYLTLSKIVCDHES
jgi:hypothetical protein